MKDEKQVEKIKTQIMSRYVSYVERKNALPSLTDMFKMGIDRNKIRYYFGSHADLRKAAKEFRPKAFERIIDESMFTPKAFKKLRDRAENFERYFVTTAVTGCKLFQPFWDSIQGFQKSRKALALVLPSTDPAANTGLDIASEIPRDQLVFDDLALNSNVYLSSIKLSAKHIDPITGLSRIGQRNGSFIYASPKQRLKMTPTSNTKLPHAMMTTGAVTLPDYDTSRYMSERTAYIAENDHVMGGIVVEISDDKMFHYRQVQADRKGNFIDLGVMYSPDGSKTQVRPEALVLGDWHSGETDQDAAAAFVGPGKDSVINVTKPRRLVIHDGFNGRSISHHEIKNRILRAQRAAQDQLSLAAELNDYARDLEYLASFPFVEEVVIVKSNHDEFLDRYLADGRYLEDPQNFEIALTLAAAMLKGKNPVQAYMEAKGFKGYEKLRWLDRDEDFKVAGIELGAHGDKGANGARGSLRAMENAYGSSVSGHSHTPEILRSAYQVGTTSLLKPGYNVGPSSWMHTSCLVYPNGSRQLINVIAGEWRLT